MTNNIKAQCKIDLHRYMRSMDVELDITSDLYQVVEAAFQAGFGAGGEYGIKRLSQALSESNGPKIDDDWQE